MEGVCGMNSPAVTYLTLDEAPQRLWSEWLLSWFDGGSHEIGPSGTGAVTFPRASVSFDQAALPQALNGVNILILQTTLDNDQFLTATGKAHRDYCRWDFFVRAGSASGDSNPAYQCRQATQLLRACLMNENATYPLAQKGIYDLEVTESETIMSDLYQLRRVRVRGSLANEFRTV